MGKSSETLKRTYLDQVEKTFVQDTDSFSKDLGAIRSLVAAVQDSESYTAAVFATDPSEFQYTYHYSSVRESFLKQCTQFRQVADGFIWFRRGDVCVSKYRVFWNSEDCFSSYFGFGESLSAEDLNTFTSGLDVLSFLPVTERIIDNLHRDNYLTVLLKPISNSAVFGFLYSEDTILHSFHINTLPEDTYFYLISNDGTTLLSHNAMPENRDAYTEFRMAVPNLSGTAVLGIPQSYFDTALHTSTVGAKRLFAFACFLGIIMCLFFSWLGVKPFRDLLRTHSAAPSPHRNEAVVIDTLLTNTRHSNDTLRNILLSNVLIRIISGMPMKDKERTILASSYPIFEKAAHFAIVYSRQEDSSENSQPLADFLLPLLPKQALIFQISLSEMCILLEQTYNLYDVLQQALFVLNESCAARFRFVCGMSAAFTGIEALPEAVRQAQVSLPLLDGDTFYLVKFDETNLANHYSTVSASWNATKFQHDLSHWCEKEVLESMDSYMETLVKHPGKHPEEVYYVIVHLLREVSAVNGISLNLQRTTYAYNMTPLENYTRLREWIVWLFRERRAVQCSDTQRLYADMITYIHQNFADPSLSLQSLVQNFCVSEQVANKAIQSTTDMNFMKYLLALRMKEASRLLTETELSISAVAEQCGCPATSTFYRNFKKAYNLAPAEYRERYSLPGLNGRKI